ncbi:MAG TPA: hypothetical protein VLK84_24665 [Longimicrobium sp.]|nr:hypothetical protein [Longimicrobium sp.]
MRDRTAGRGWTRLPLLAAGWLLTACGSGSKAAAVVPAEVAPAPSQPARQGITQRDIRVCVVQNGGLVDVTAVYDTVTRDTSFGPPGRDGGTAARNEYAAGTAWFTADEPLPWRGYRFVKYGPERVLPPELLARAGEHRGIPFFREAGMDGGPLYVPVRQGCVFQPYSVDYLVGGVCG